MNLRPLLHHCVWFHSFIAVHDDSIVMFEIRGAPSDREKAIFLLSDRFKEDSTDPEVTFKTPYRPSKGKQISRPSHDLKSTPQKKTIDKVSHHCCTRSNSRFRTVQ